MPISLAAILVIAGAAAQAAPAPAARPPTPSAAPVPPPATGGALTLDAALDEAGRANLDLEQGRIALQRSDAVVLGSYQGFLPRLDVSGSFGRDFVAEQRSVNLVPDIGYENGVPVLKGFKQEPVKIPATDYADYGVTLTLQERLFEGLRTVGVVGQARAQKRAAQLALDEAALDTAALVTQRFYAVVKAEQSLTVLEETAAQSRELVGRADALFAAGRVPRDNTMTARVNLGNDLINVESQRATVAQARGDLAVALGRAADPDLRVQAPADIAAPRFERASYEPPSLDALVARAREARPARGRDRELVEAARHGVTVARADYFPAVGVGASYARQAPELGGSTGVFGPLSHQYYAKAQVFVQWNLFGGLGTVSQSEQAQADLARARVSEAQTDQTITSEVATARAALVALGRAARLAEDNLASATEAVRLATQRFEAGAATQIEVRDAQLKLTTARLAIVSTRSDFAVAFASLNRAVGGGL